VVKEPILDLIVFLQRDH